MPRLRVRVELNRGGVGIPLHKLSSVVGEAQKFFQMLAEDVRIEKSGGEWLAFDLDNGSLNFTAEYVGPVSAEQVRAFYAAFDGVTSLRRATISQFTRITEAIGEDELIGFGLYQSDQEAEPGEWRCLSRRDALRISDEIRMLQGVAGEPELETHLRAVIDSVRGAQLFKQRHDRGAAAAEQTKWSSFVRSVETNLVNRISRLEDQVESHSLMIQDLSVASSASQDSVRNLLSSVEKFCGEATQRIEQLTPSQAQPPPYQIVPPASPGENKRRRWQTVALVIIACVGLASIVFQLWLSKQPGHADREALAASSPTTEASKSAGQGKASSSDPVQPANPGEAPSALTKPKAFTNPRDHRQDDGASSGSDRATLETSPELSAEPVMQISMEARAPAWVSVTDHDGRTLLARTLQLNEAHTLALGNGATLRTGNAGALELRVNGKEVGPLGPAGKVREIEFNEGTFRIHAPTSGADRSASTR